MRPRGAMRQAQGNIYFIQLNNFIKIGITNDITAQLESIRTHNPYPIELVRLITNCNVCHEQWLHKHFEHLWVHRKWFKFDNEMLTIQPPEGEPAQLTPAMKIPETSAVEESWLSRIKVSLSNEKERTKYLQAIAVRVFNKDSL